MTELSKLLGLLCAEAVLGLLFWFVYRNLSRLYPRPHLVHWTHAWALLLAHLVVALGDGVVANVFGPVSVARALTATLYTATSNLGLSALAVGMYEFVENRALDPRTIRVVGGIGIALAAVVGLAPLSGVLPVEWAHTFPEAPRAMCAVVAACGALAATLRQGPRQGWDRGMLLSRAGLLGLIGAQGYAAVLSLAPDAPAWTPAQTVLDVLVWSTLGVGVVTWILEREHGRLQEVTQAHRAREIGRAHV